MMKYFPKAVFASLLVVTTPSLIAYPEINAPFISAPRALAIPDIYSLSYDEVIDLLSCIESDSFEACSLEELTQINQLLSFLALEGAREIEKEGVAISIASLLQGDTYHYATDFNAPYAVQPAIFKGNSSEIALCKSWAEKKWDQTRKFVKKHKKEILIGAIIVVAVTVVVVTAVVISSSAAGVAAGGIAASMGEMDSGSSSLYPSNSDEKTPIPGKSLTSSLEEQISSFKEKVAPEQIAAILNSREISIEENGRMIGSLFTHKTVDALTHQARDNPFLSYELQDLRVNSHYPAPKWASSSPHTCIDQAFSTDYFPTWSSSTDLNTLSYQTRGDWALSSGYYNQAIQDFGRAIEIEPTHPDSYLGRGLAHFELNQFEESVSDFNTYSSLSQTLSSAADFSMGFAQGLPKGIYDSGEGMFLFLSDLAQHPIQTSEKVYDSLSTLSRLAKSGEWDLIAESLSPELHQLIHDWDILTHREKGELSGYAFGKHGADIFLPGATAKAAAKGALSAKELGAICKNLKSAEKVLVLETVAEGSIGVNAGEVITSTRKTLRAGEELGLTAKEMAALKQSGELERVIGKGRDFFAKNPEMQASYDLFKKAQDTLAPYVKQSMPETEIRALIHQSGILTFPRPVGIPENYLVKITKKGAGMEYIHPTKEKTSIRVMPGKVHSTNHCQQKPYVIQIKNGKTLDKFGNVVSPDSPEAHIPFHEFIYQD